MYPEISVLMSIYNETINEVRDAVESILNQTYQNFEFIIVLDNPRRVNEISSFLEGYKSDRIELLCNEKNIGLAMSMNRAAKYARGNYLARMDADDISEIDRFNIQINCMKSMGYDLTCTSYIAINENGEKIDCFVREMNDFDLFNNLPFDNTIHHPTVMLKKEVFNKVAGYRNFPCAQDYDLWIRLYEKGIIMHYINKPLLQYRIRKQSVSQSSKIRQLLTIWYIQELYRERRRKGKDSFTREAYTEYLKRNKFYDKKYMENANKCKAIKDEIDQLKTSNIRINCRMIKQIELILISPFYRKYFWMIGLNYIGIKFLKIRVKYDNRKNEIIA